MKKKRLIYAGLVVFGLFLGLGLVEGLVRILFPHTRDSVIPGRLFVIDEDLGWKFAPSKMSRHRTRYFDVTYAIDALGFRDKSRTITKTGYRALMYGDSLVFGWGINQGERFSDLIESASDGLQIWNHAVPGYGLDQEVLSYEKEADIPASEVMFFVGTSTLSRIHTGYMYAKYKPVFTYGPAGGLTVKSPPKWKNRAVSLVYQTLSPFYLPYFLQGSIANLQGAFRRPPPKPADDRPETRSPRRSVDGLSKALLLRAWNTAKRKNHRMTILVANLDQADRNELRSFCAENGIGCLEIGAEFSTMPGVDVNKDYIFGEYDAHWNANGNKLIAEQLLPLLNQRQR